MFVQILLGVLICSTLVLFIAGKQYYEENENLRAEAQFDAKHIQEQNILIHDLMIQNDLMIEDGILTLEDLNKYYKRAEQARKNGRAICEQNHAGK